MLHLSAAVIEGLAWSLLWSISVFVLIFRYPWLIEHDYPKDVREAAQIPSPTSRQKRAGVIFSIVAFVILLGTLLTPAFVHYGNASPSFLTLFDHLWIICFSWNLFDLLILDWLLICTLTPKWLILPGTEHCKGYKDYRFHFKGFLHGCLYMTLFSLFFAGLVYWIIRLVMR